MEGFYVGNQPANDHTFDFLVNSQPADDHTFDFLVNSHPADYHIFAFLILVSLQMTTFSFLILLEKHEREQKQEILVYPVSCILFGRYYLP